MLPGLSGGDQRRREKVNATMERRSVRVGADGLPGPRVLLRPWSRGLRCRPNTSEAGRARLPWSSPPCRIRVAVDAPKTLPPALKGMPLAGDACGSLAGPALPYSLAECLDKDADRVGVEVANLALVGHARFHQWDGLGQAAEF